MMIYPELARVVGHEMGSTMMAFLENDSAIFLSCGTFPEIRILETSSRPSGLSIPGIEVSEYVIRKCKIPFCSNVFQRDNIS
jgi:hypothetical protein